MVIALAFIYRLTNYYLPGTPDGDLLHMAAREVLQEFVRLDEWHELEKVKQEGRKRFDEQINWLLLTKVKKGRLSIVVQYLTEVASVAVFVYGTVALSSQIFISLGDVVPVAVQKLLDLGYEAGIIPRRVEVEFVR